MKRLALSFIGIVASLHLVHATEPTSDGWTTGSPRDEITPKFRHDPRGGRDRKGALVTESDARDGLAGWWTRTVPVQGGRWYRFEAFRRIKNVVAPHRSVVARVLWLDDSGTRHR